MMILNTMLDLTVYAVVGIVIMMLGYLLIDLVIPCDFPKEIKEGNKSVGWVSAGIYIGLGLIIKASVESLDRMETAFKLWYGVIDTAFYAVAGIVFFLLGYFVIDLVNRRYNFNQELKAKNEAIGIMIFGIFIGIALIISGVIR